jgi:hypothetical protein
MNAAVAGADPHPQPPPRGSPAQCAGRGAIWPQWGRCGAVRPCAPARPPLSMSAGRGAFSSVADDVGRPSRIGAQTSPGSLCAGRGGCREVGVVMLTGFIRFPDQTTIRPAALTRFRGFPRIEVGASFAQISKISIGLECPRTRSTGERCTTFGKRERRLVPMLARASVRDWPPTRSDPAHSIRHARQRARARPNASGHGPVCGGVSGIPGGDDRRPHRGGCR